jgi:hypothetical protein
MRKNALCGVLAAFAGLTLLFVAGSFSPASASTIPLGGLAQAQNPSSSGNKVKVWTNDDLVSTRTPADLYMFQKEAQAAANDAAVMNAVSSCFASGHDEAAIAQTQRSIQETTNSVRDAEGAIAQATREYQAAPANLRARNQLELDRRTAELEALRRQLRTLQDRLQQLTADSDETQP